MGVHIAARHILSVQPEETWGGSVMEPTTKDVEGWDESRYAGDREVPTAEGIEYISPAWDEEWEYCRPKDLTAFAAWVDGNIKPEGNRERWHTLIAKMRADDTIWLRFCW